MGQGHEEQLVLVVDDEADFAEVVAMTLEAEGYRVMTCHDGGRARQIMGREPIDLLVADVNMPVLDGFTLCRQLRERGDPTPIILLTTRDGDIDEALGLELGADDYIAKPLNRRVLTARVRALLRRERLRAGARAGEVEGAADPEEQLAGAGVALDLARLEVRCGGRRVEMTVTELRLLEALMRRPGRVLTRGQLLAHMRGEGQEAVYDRMVDAYIARVRAKLREAAPGFEAIETVIGAGYRWSEA